jgi:hypothetical protein
MEQKRGILHYNFITRQFAEAKFLLSSTEREGKYDSYCRASVIMAFVGAAVGILFENIFLIPILGLFGLFIPLFLLKVTAIKYGQQFGEDVEAVLSAITGSYMQSNDLLASISDNMNSFSPSLKRVFGQFLAQTKYIRSNVPSCLTELKNEVPNSVFKEWCDAMILCQSNRSNKYILQSIISKLTVTQSTEADMAAKIYEPLRTNITIIIMSALIFPLLYFLNKTWWANLFTLPGKIAVAVWAAAVLFDFYRVLKATRPIKYERG